MPLPCPQVLEDMFDLYEKIREPDRTSLLGRVKNTMEKIAYSYFSKKEPTFEKIEQIRKDIMALVKLIKVKEDNNKFDIWISLIFTLGLKAKEAQELKYFPDEESESLFCETLHAMRSYIISSLSNNDVEICKKKFAQYIEALQQATKKIHEAFEDAVKYDNGRNADEYLKKYHENILRLAFLEDKNAIIVARKAGLLDYLNVYQNEKLLHKYKMSPNHANSFIPFCLQRNFFETLYHHEYQSVHHITFKDFESRAVKKSGFDRLNVSIQESEFLLTLQNTSLTETSSSYRTFQKKLLNPEVKAEANAETPTHINANLYLEYLMLYDIIRQPNRISTTGKLKNVAEMITGTVTGKDTTVCEIDKTKNFIISEITDINTTDDEEEKFALWFKLIFTLGEKAEIAQKLKYQDNESLFCQTLHALRSYTVYSLARDPVFKEFFKNEVKNLQDEALEWDRKLHKDVWENNGINASFYLNSYRETITKLALLEDKEAIIQARENKLFGYLKTYQRKELTSKRVDPSIANPFIPYCLHPEFFRILYSAEYQANQSRSFDDFVSSFQQLSLLAHEDYAADQSDEVNPNNASQDEGNDIASDKKEEKVPELEPPSPQINEAQLHNTIFPPPSTIVNLPPEEKPTHKVQL